MRRSLAACVILLAGCNTHQSALAPFGVEARSTLHLTLVLSAGAVVIAAGLALVYVLAVRAPEGKFGHAAGMRLVFWLGAVFPTVVLTALLLWALPAMRPLPTQAGDLHVRVEGEQFWWRVSYRDGERPPLLSANEVRIPAGRSVVFDLTAMDVIHSFWIPGLAGKMDMIPGRTNRLVVKADKVGTYRGVCAEFCGLSHALMAFEVIVMEPAAFDAWMQKARKAPTRSTIGGARLFAAHGCGACHTVGGTEHNARIGPDLTRFGERATLGAGILTSSTPNTAAFIREPSRFKPGSRMPSFTAMPQRDAIAIATWLEEGR